ncbi:MAG: Gfo/Idh/MocA family oxidoreductase [Patescibacteria group bacterium]
MPKKDKRFRAAIVGAGSIAALYDTPRSRGILTHAHAFFRHPKTDLVGICDIDPRAAAKAARRWGCTAYADLGAMLRETAPDIVSVCTPDTDHVATLLRVAKARPRLVICEKPVAPDMRGLRTVAKAYTRIPLLVNFSYRFGPRLRDFRDGLRSGAYGKVLTASAIYVKGLRHNGSHIIDLARFLFGDVVSACALGSRVDFHREDSCVSAVLSFRRCPEFHLMIGDARRAFMFELDVVCEKRRFRLVDVGFRLEEQAVTSDATYPSYRTLGNPSAHASGMDMAMLGMADNAVRHLDRGEPLACVLADAEETQAVCDTLLEQVTSR